LARHIQESGVAAERVVENIAERISKLRELRSRLLEEKHTFVPGQPVRWKKNLKNRRKPAYDEPAIVIELLPQPVFDTKDEGASSPYFREPLDIVLGLVDDDNELVAYHFDSRRFEPFPE
jgi:hypothetical protein